jgi:SAM-dependent methyltransferase
MAMTEPVDILEYYADSGLSATFYDMMTLVDKTVEGDLQFYQSLAGSSPRQILVLGCGTGRVAMALARAGHQVVGIDNAHSMLSRAELKKKRLPASVAQLLDFRPGDMTRLELEERFDLVLIPYYGFSHLLESSQRAQTLRVMARHLRPQGWGVIHVPAPWALREAGTPSFRPRPGYQARLQSEKVAEVAVALLKQSFDESRQRFSQMIEYVVKDKSGQVTRRTHERLTYALFEDDELRRFAADAGLRLDRIVSSFQGKGDRHRVYILAHQ